MKLRSRQRKTRPLTDFEPLRTTSMSNEIGREMWVQCLIMQRLSAQRSTLNYRLRVAQAVVPLTSHIWQFAAVLAPSAVSITLSGSWSTIYKLSLTKVNALLSASYQLFHPTDSNEAVIRTIGYSSVAPNNVTYFGSPRALWLMSKLVFNVPTLPDGDLEFQEVSETFAPCDPVLFDCSSMITPTCLRMLYYTRRRPFELAIHRSLPA